MMFRLNRDLPKRIPNAQRDPGQDRFAAYVRWGRCQRGWDRAELAARAGLDRLFLTFLENGLLEPGELTDSQRQAIETALGLPYDDEVRLHPCDAPERLSSPAGVHG